MIPEGVKTDKSDNLVTQNYVKEHVEIGIASLRMIIDEKKTVKHFEVRLVIRYGISPRIALTLLYGKTRNNLWWYSIKELRAKQYRPVYYLMGEESYYIDLISDYIVDNVLTDTEKVFNLTVVYGADVDIATVINAPSAIRWCPNARS